MVLRQGVSPPAEELQAYSLGKCEPQRAEEIEAFLTSGPDCAAILAAAPEDALVQHLRAAGELPPVDVPARSAATLPGQGATSTGPAVDIGTDATTLLDHPRYRFLRKLGQGGMGTVYLAEHRLMRRLVAIKLIRPGSMQDPKFVECFRQEVQATASLSHPHIVTAHDADEIAGTHVLVMEYVEGESLDQRLARQGKLPAAEACAAVRQAALGLQFAHRKGMVHRDIKPHNLIRTAEGTVKLLDFGLARFFHDEAPLQNPSAERTITGTADYIAPEQAQDSRQADIRADIYSLGCTLYQLLAGHVPFPGGSAVDKIIRHTVARPEPLSGEVPAALAAVIGKMMAKKPADRYQTPAEVLVALEPFASPTVASARPRRGALILVLVVVAALLAILAAAVYTFAIKGASELPPDDRNPKGSKHVSVAPASFAPKSLVEERRLAWPTKDHLGTAFSPDGRCCMGWSGKLIRVWETETNQLVQEITGLAKIVMVRFLPDGKQLLSSHDDGAFRRWDLKTGKLLDQFFTQPGWYQFQGFTTAGNGFGTFNAPPSHPKGVIQIWNLTTGKELFHIEPAHATAALFASAPLSPDGKRVLTVDRLGSGESVMRIFDAATGSKLQERALKLAGDSHAWSADSRRICLNSSDPDLQAVVIACLDAASGELISKVPLQPAPGSTHGRRFSPDIRFFVVQYPDSRLLHMYDVASGQLIGVANTVNTDFSVSFSPDGRYLACGSPGAVLFFRLPEPIP